MEKIEAIIRPETVAPVRDALVAAGACGMTFTQAQGMGAQHGFTEYYRGTEVLVQTQPKVLVTVVCEDKDTDALCKVVADAARTGEGHVGDGKIFVSPVSRAIRIRTGECDEMALREPGTCGCDD